MLDAGVIYMNIYSNAYLHWKPGMFSAFASWAAPLVQCVVCLSSVTFCIVVKQYVLAKNCLKERI